MSVQSNKANQEVVVPVLSEDQIRSEIAAEYELKFAALSAKLDQVVAEKATPAVVKPNNNAFGINPLQPVEEVGDTLVHFVDDGFTSGSVMYYRGQEAYLSEAKANLTARDQKLMFGKVFYSLGPWPGLDYDLDDPNLNETEREKLARVVAQTAR